MRHPSSLGPCAGVLLKQGLIPADEMGSGVPWVVLRADVVLAVMEERVT